MSPVVCRRGVARGAVSQAFSAQHLLDALKEDDTEHVYVEVDSGGWLTEAGGRGAARLCVRARLAPHALGAGALLAAGGGALRLRAAAPLAPHAELLLWFAEDALAALDMPFLTLRNIRGRTDYTCHDCGLSFDDPNPLKVHLFLSCATFDPARFWGAAVARFQAAELGPAAVLGPGALQPGTPGPGTLGPAQLEVLATEWGRARGGHVCVYCGKLYSRRYGLKIHLRTHTGYRPLRCRHCLRAFGDPSNLNKHERLHAARAHGLGPGGLGPGRLGPERLRPCGLGPARYPCGQCGRALARRRDLERHERTHERRAEQ